MRLEERGAYVERLKYAFDTMTLGELRDALMRAPEAMEVRFDFCASVPAELASWRGDYSQLALGFTLDRWESPKEVRARDLVTKLQSAIGFTFEGYKGGKYTMDEQTPVWVDNFGDCTHTAIVAVNIDYYALLHTVRVE